jgi:arsenate reductase
VNTIIWHNPRCSKSRQTLSLLREHGVDPLVVEYLKNPPAAKELRGVLKKLGVEPRGLMRTQESIYRELGLDGVVEDDALIDAMVAHPKLIERPVVVRGNRAALGRPPENVLALLE